MTGRPTATARNIDDEPFDRDEYARILAWRLDRPISTRPVRLDEAEGTVVAKLLYELAGVYPDEPLGSLARYLAMTLSERSFL